MANLSRFEPLFKRDGTPAYTWLERLQAIVDRHAHLAANGSRVLSNQTKELRIERLKHCFRELRGLGYKIDDPRSIKPKHIEALVQHWEQTEKAAATIQNKVSALRTFCSWIGKPGMVKATASYASSPERVKVQTSATESKAWSDHSIDINAKIAEIEAYDRHVGMQVRLCLSFGLRRREAVMMKPHRADRGDVLHVNDGTKGGRDRIVAIDSVLKRETLDAAKELVGPNKNAHMGGKRGGTLEQALQRYTNVLYRCGVNTRELEVTGHGLRHEYMNDRYEELTGEASPVRGGAKPEKGVETLARMVVAEEAGHTRLNITAAYYGTHKHLAHVEKQRRANAACNQADGTHGAGQDEQRPAPGGGNQVGGTPSL